MCIRDSFYRVTVVHEGAWVLEAINAEGSVFLDALNAQAARFGAQLVISHVAHQDRDRDASPASSSAPAPRRTWSAPTAPPIWARSI